MKKDTVVTIVCCFVLLARCVFRRNEHTLNLEFSFRPDFWCAVIDCTQSEPKIKMLFLHFASSKEDGLPAGVSDKVFANLQQ